MTTIDPIADREESDVRLEEPEFQDEETPPAGPWAPYVAGAVPLAFGLVMLWGSIALGVGTLTAPQPGLWPCGLSILLIALSIGLLIGRSRFGHGEAFDRGALLVVLGALSIAGFVLLLPLIGFEITALAIMVLWLKGFGRERWRVVAIVPIVTVAAFHLLFIELFGVRIPHLIAF